MSRVAGRVFSVVSLVATVAVLAMPSSSCAWPNGGAARDVRVVYIEPLEKSEADVYRIVADPGRIKMYNGWLANESARMALDFFGRAWALTSEGRRGEPPVYYVALLPGGNYGAVGFRLLDEPHPTDHARTSFIKLAPEDWAFSTTFLHETGHVVLSMLNRGSTIPKRPIAAISHTTAALTDRGTAFDEGFAIHLETLAAHIGSEPYFKERYKHGRFLFGAPDMLGEYHRHAADLMSFSQTIARYYEVRENNFAFSPAFKGPDYLRVQLEKSRDFASLRDANQLLQSEGFYASFFFGVLMRGKSVPSAAVIHERQDKILAALSDMLGSGTRSAEDPFLQLFVEAYIRKFPAEASELIDVLLDLSHGVFVDKQAPALWRGHYLGALRLDLAERNNKEIEDARRAWRVRVAKDPKALYSNLGPQIRASVSGVSVTLVAFEDTSPLSFDVNTAEEGIMRMIPGINEAEVASWLLTRSDRPFANREDFERRAGLTRESLDKLSF